MHACGILEATWQSSIIVNLYPRIGQALIEDFKLLLDDRELSVGQSTGFLLQQFSGHLQGKEHMHSGNSENSGQAVT